MKTERMTLSITNLSCGGGGALTVERRLLHTAGVVHASVNPATEMAYIEYDPERTDPQRLVEAVNQTGFRAGTPYLR